MFIRGAAPAVNFSHPGESVAPVRVDARRAAMDSTTLGHTGIAPSFEGLLKCLQSRASNRSR